MGIGPIGPMGPGGFGQPGFGGPAAGFDPGMMGPDMILRKHVDPYFCHLDNKPQQAGHKAFLTCSSSICEF